MKYLAMLLLLLLVASPLWADVLLFYGGDFDPNNPNANGLANENDAIVGGIPYGAATYQNFIISTYDTTVTGLYTNNLSLLSRLPVIGKSARIFRRQWRNPDRFRNRHGGSFSQTPTGRSGFGFTEYNDLVVRHQLSIPPCPLPCLPVPIGSRWFRRSRSSRPFIQQQHFRTQPGRRPYINQQYFNSFFGADFTNADNEGVFPTFSAGVYNSAARALDPAHVWHRADWSGRGRMAAHTASIAVDRQEMAINGQRQPLGRSISR